MRPSLVALALAAASVLACSGGEATVDPATLAVPVVAPWDALALPLAGGNVMMADATLLTVSFPEKTVDALEPKFDAAIEAKGWTEASRSADGGLVMVSYTQGAQTLSVSAVQATDTASITLSLAGG